MATTGLFFGFPARSHTLPSLSLVRELADRDVRLNYYSTSGFRSLIEANGARFVAYPDACEALAAPTDLSGHIKRVVDVTVKILPYMLHITEEEHPSFVIFDGSALWGRIIAQEQDSTSVASITTFAFTRSMLQLLSASQPSDVSLTKMLSVLNRSYLQDYADVVVPQADIKIVYTSRFFQPGGRFFDNNHFFVGPLVERRPREGDTEVPSASRSLAYISFGTIFNRDISLLKTISRIVSEAGWTVVVSLGDPNSEMSGHWPPDVQVYPFVDQMAVLAQARLVVTHGGMGSVSEALAHGIPLVVVPQSVDQYLVGRRVVELGAGVMVDAKASTDEWDSALKRVVLQEQQFVAGASRINSSFTSATSISEIIPRILGCGPGLSDASNN